MKILLIVLGVLALLMVLPLGGRVCYSEKGLTVFLRVGPILVRLYPSSKEKVEKEEMPKKEKEKPEIAQKHPKGGLLSTVQGILPMVGPTLRKLKRKLTIDILDLRVTWAANDPADAALGFGYASAAMGTLWAVISENFKVKDHRLDCDVDFMADKPRVYGEAQLSLNLWKILTLVLPLLVQFLKIRSQIQRENPKSTGNEA